MIDQIKLRRPLVCTIALLLFFSCKKEGFITSGEATIAVSADTLAFDTVFSNSGSVTLSFKIFNTNKQKLILSSVSVAGGDSSPFKINVDGTPGPLVKNIEINGNDSIYVFVEVNAPALSLAAPFILSDSISINYNGNHQFVQLQAYGQNAVFLKNKVITGNVAWSDTLPYVILGQLQVDTGAMLTIPEGTKVYLHANAPFLVDGSLVVNGTAEKPVVFTGDRLDIAYKDLPAGWPGIFFRSKSENNVLRHAIIKNAYQGMIVQGIVASTPKVTLHQSIIDNIFDAGILALNTSIYADNCLVSNCGSNIEIALGGDYRFINCTVASYGNNFIPHQNPVLQMTDYATNGSNTYFSALNALFQNCIFWGDNGNADNEIIFDKQGTAASSVIFDHVLYKAKNAVSNVTFTAAIQNEDPLFDSINIIKNIFDFHLGAHPASPCINAGVANGFIYDLDNKPRTAGVDLGCYQSR